MQRRRRRGGGILEPSDCAAALPDLTSFDHIGDNQYYHDILDSVTGLSHHESLPPKHTAKLVGRREHPKAPLGGVNQGRGTTMATVVREPSPPCVD